MVFDKSLAFNGVIGTSIICSLAILLLSEKSTMTLFMNVSENLPKYSTLTFRLNERSINLLTYSGDANSCCHSQLAVILL